MQSWWKRLNRRYNKIDKRIISTILCCLLTFSGVGIAVQQVFASDKDPKIEVSLESATPNPAKPGQEIEVTYTVKPNDFKYAANTNNTEDKEVVFLIDKSKSMTEAEKMKTGLTNDMVNALIKNNNTSKVNFTTISYNDNVVVDEVDPNAKDNNGVPIDYRNAVQNSISTILNANNSTNDIRNLGQAIKKATDFFDGNGNTNSIKNIIIISEGEPTDQLPNIDTNKYNVITLAISDKASYDNPYSKIKEWHTALGGSDDNYYISSAAENHNDINSNTSVSGNDKGEIIKRIAKKLEGINYQSYSFINAKLNFNLGDNFEPVSGLTLIGDNSNRCTIDLPEIQYRAISSDITGTQYLHQASSFKVSFKIKPKAGKVGDLGFVENSDENNPNNYILYNKLNETEMTKEPINTPKIKVQEKIRILEIEPADSFKITLNSSNTSIKSGSESGLNDEGKDITIDHISMPEFIGKVDKINGKYDIIVVGRYVNNNLPNDQKKYKDYTVLNDASHKESDITDRKTKELQEFVDTGQLVYMDKNIFNTNIQNTKLYKNFNNFIPKIQDNYVKNKSISELQLDTILNDFSNVQENYKRINFSIDNKPLGDSRDAERGLTSNRKLEYTINVGNYNGNITENLYLDVNGDGLFKDNERIYTSGATNDINKLKNISYIMSNTFVGELKWKVELVKDNGIKSYETGNMYFRAIDGGKRVIKVLQIAPYPQDSGKYNTLKTNLQRDLRDGNEYTTGTTNPSDLNNGKFIYSNLNLKTNPTFQSLLGDLKDYDIQIDVMSIYEFNLRAGSDSETIKKAQAPTLQNKGVKESLVNNSTWTGWQNKGELTVNGNYNMIIFGFSNAYSGIEDRVNQSFSTNAVNDVKLFIQSGQSVMFTHDTMYYENQWTNNATRAFRDWSGLSRYVYGDNQSQQDYDSTPIPHDTSTGNGNRIADGVNSNTVYKTNESLITNYPFELDDKISVRTMHNQWFQLNLEDEDVIPGFTMTNKLDQNINPYDSRNNYYTFSRGNITYSGTAENQLENRDYPESEMQLFVNTIAKSIRGANNAPTLDTRNLNDTVSKYQDEFDFQVIPNDLDNDLVNVEVKIERKSSESAANWEDVRTDSFENTRPGTVLPISILQDIYNHNDSNKYKYLRITITARDEHGAEATQIQKEIEIINTPLLNVNLNSDKTGYLIGDDITLNATVKPSAKVTGNMGYSNINMSLVDYNNGGVFNFLSGNAVLKFNDIDKQNSSVQTQTYKFNITNQSMATTDKAEVYNISANYNYNIDDNKASNDTNGSITKAISVLKGQIIVSAKGINTNNVYDVNLGIAPKIQIKKSGTIIREDYINIADGKVVFDNMPSGQYDVYIDSIAGYEAVDNHKSKEISYDNNIGNVQFDLIPNVKHIRHGLYQNVDSGELSVREGSATLPRGSIATIAAGCDISSSNLTIKLQINKDVDIIDNPIKIYKISGRQLIELSGASASLPITEGEYNSYSITLPPGITTETKIVIRYQSKIPTEVIINPEDGFENNILINEYHCPFTLEIASDPLPDLF